MSDVNMDHAAVLNTLARCDAAELKQFVDVLLETIEDIDVIENRTGLVMLPLRDPVQGTAFHLGEVLMSEAHIQMMGQVGYGMRTGRDLAAAMAMAVVDAAWQAGHALDDIGSFLSIQIDSISVMDTDRLRDVEATRVNMETF